MPKPRCRRIPFLRRMIMPSLIILLILKNIIQINCLIPNCPSSSKHIQPLIPILARPMILPWQERITVSYIRTQHFELISFLNPRNQFRHVTSTGRFHVDPQRGICWSFTKIVYHVMVNRLLAININNRWLNSHEFWDFMTSQCRLKYDWFFSRLVPVFFDFTDYFDDQDVIHFPCSRDEVAERFVEFVGESFWDGKCVLMKQVLFLVRIWCCGVVVYYRFVRVEDVAVFYFCD